MTADGLSSGRDAAQNRNSNGQRNPFINVYADSAFELPAASNEESASLLQVNQDLETKGRKTHTAEKQFLGRPDSMSFVERNRHSKKNSQHLLNNATSASSSMFDSSRFGRRNNSTEIYKQFHKEHKLQQKLSNNISILQSRLTKA